MLDWGTYIWLFSEELLEADLSNFTVWNFRIFKLTPQNSELEGIYVVAPYSADDQPERKNLPVFARAPYWYDAVVLLQTLFNGVCRSK